jgi:membrane associated rhomboid family serine protease
MALPQYRLRTFQSYFPPGVKWLIIINTLVFLIYSLGGEGIRGHMYMLALSTQAVVFNFPWFVWQLFTYLFMHASITHLLFNMLSLWMFGATLEQTWGTRRFLRFYFLCGIGAGICDVAVNALLGRSTPTIGASGAIYGLLLAFGVLFPDVNVLMGFLFPIKAKYMVMIYGAIALWSAVGSGNSGVSNIAHLGGMLFAWVYLKAPMPRVRLPRVDIAGAYRQWQMQRAKKKFQVYMRKKGGGPWVN